MGDTPERRDQQEITSTFMAIDFKTESGSPFHVRLNQFEGPLDVLLALIRQQELDIYDIPIAQVTDQYLAFLRAMEEMDLAIAGEFLLLAATLIEIKSNYLLPKPAPAEAEPGPDPRDELVQRLLEYEKYKEIASFLAQSEESRRLLYSRAIEIDPDDLPSLPSGLVSSLDLLNALKRVLEDVGEGREPITSIPRQKLTIRMKMSEIFRRVKESGGRMPFSTVFSEERTRAEVVVVFLALLELLRLNKVEALQEAQFGEIYISVVEEAAESDA